MVHASPDVTAALATLQARWGSAAPRVVGEVVGALATVPLPSAREQSKAVALQDGSILVAGGDAGYFPPASTPWCPKAITATLRYIPAP